VLRSWQGKCASQGWHLDLFVKGCCCAACSGLGELRSFLLKHKNFLSDTLASLMGCSGPAALPGTTSKCTAISSAAGATAAAGAASKLSPALVSCMSTSLFDSQWDAAARRGAVSAAANLTWVFEPAASAAHECKLLLLCPVVCSCCLH